MIRCLEFKCSPVCSLCCASVLTVLVIIGCLIGSILAFLFDGFRNFAVVALIGGSIIICIWIIMLISLLFRKHVVVTDDEIIVYRWSKVKWKITRNEIKELIFYDILKWYMFILPIVGIIEASELCVRLNSGKISVKYRCNISLKNARKISENFGYPLKVIDIANK